MIVAGAALAAFAGLGALTGIICRTAFTKRRYGLERIVSFRLLTLAVIVVWAFSPFALFVLDTDEVLTSDARFVLMTFALPVALVGYVWTYRRRITAKVLSVQPGTPLVHSDGDELRVLHPAQAHLPARTLPTPF